jgi:phage tail sheath protein FI
VLLGATRDEAYSVRCDATTTTQNDLDQGRVIAEVRFMPAHPVGQITVMLALREGSVAATEGGAS